MGKLKIECLQKKLKVKTLAKAVYTVLGQKENIKAEVVFESGVEMTDLNRTARGVDSITDVLSFPSLEGIRGEVLTKRGCNTELDGKYIFIGSIVLCEEKIKVQAQELGHSEEEERNYLIIHGLMHLFGYDHIKEEDKQEMREKEKESITLMNAKRDRKERLKKEREERRKQRAIEREKRIEEREIQRAEREAQREEQRKTKEEAELQATKQRQEEELDELFAVDENDEILKRLKQDKTSIDKGHKE